MQRVNGEPSSLVIVRGVRRRPVIVVERTALEAIPAPLAA